MAKRNLFGQMTYAINKNFTERVDKRAFKKANGGGMGSKIFSYGEKYRLKQLAKSFQIYAKKNNLNVKLVKEIKAEYIQGFLEGAKERGCTQNTINSYANSLFKIQNTLNSTYNLNLKWREEIAIPQVEKKSSSTRGVDSVISREDYNKILNYAEENMSQSGLALQMQNWLGVRVEEIARIKKEFISLKDRTITFKNTKGGKVLIRNIPEDKIDFVKSVIEHNFHEDRLFSIEGKSINKYLNRVQDQLGLERHSNHDIRRLIAQEKYDSFREKGMSIKEAANETGKWLSHGDDRLNMLERSYIKLR
ncbi:tyrosine-type recombinase/integrase [Clostridium sp.]|uniref:tyrosine-type recombinase/integrase n=3 Tax=Clostridium sp. TaxID=1506 RepID=UPI0039963AC0